MEEYQEKANIVRALCLIATTEAGSGHPTSCLSAADIVTVLFDKHFAFDLKNPKNPNNDRFILSKGHASPLLYTVFALAGGLKTEELLKLRKFDSTLEGHPTPRFQFTTAATGSLGQGLSVGAGIALLAKKEGLSHKTFVLLGDGELAEGQIYEAAKFASHNSLNNLIAIADINALGQTGKTMYGHDIQKYENIFFSLGFTTKVVDGHNFIDIEKVFEEALSNTSPHPYIILAKTVKGKGVSFLEGREDFHGKAVKKEELIKALAELSVNQDIVNENRILFHLKAPVVVNVASETSSKTSSTFPSYTVGQEIATREAFGDALVTVGQKNPEVYVLDGDVANSTFTEKFQKAVPDRFIECFIAEQNMVSVALGLSSVGKIPFVATFGAFLTRAYDQIRMAAISGANIKFVGSHAGVSIGEDGPSQMALEDIAMFAPIPGSVILQPSDAVSCAKLVFSMLDHQGISYLRTLRPKTKVIYENSSEFKIGGSKVLKKDDKHKIVIVVTGIAVHEALSAYEALKLEKIPICIIDAYSIKPLDTKTILDCVNSAEIKAIISVEDHYYYGGLGAMVAQETVGHCIHVEKMAVKEIPRSGSKEELLAFAGISARQIVERVKKLIG